MTISFTETHTSWESTARETPSASPARRNRRSYSQIQLQRRHKRGAVTEKGSPAAFCWWWWWWCFVSVFEKAVYFQNENRLSFSLDIFMSALFSTKDSLRQPRVTVPCWSLCPFRGVPCGIPGFSLCGSVREPGQGAEKSRTYTFGSTKGKSSLIHFKILLFCCLIF